MPSPEYSLPDVLERYAIHEPHLPQDEAVVYRDISGEQFHGSSAS